MSSYRVALDGQDILSYEDPSLALINANLTLEISAAGSFDFTMPRSHKRITALSLLTSTIDVYEDNEVIFTGRPVSVDTDYYNQLKVYCEGALSYLNDSVQGIRDSYETSIITFFESLINNHNSQVSSNRRFTIGRITVGDEVVDRELNYDTTYDAIKRYCLETNGGYLFVRKENGVNYIDWLASMPGSNNQDVRFGVNLLDLSSKLDLGDIATCLIPLGASQTSEEDYGIAYPLTVESVIGSDTIETSAVSTYGRITKVQNFSEITDALALYNRGVKWLEDEQFGEIELEVTAAELHFLNPSVSSFKIGQMVQCYSEPHFLNKTIAVQRITINLNTAEKKITLGKLKKQKLTELYAQYPSSDQMNNINKTVTDSKKRIVKMETDMTDGFTMTVSEVGGDGFVSLNVGLGQAIRTGRIRITGNVDISGELSAEALYAAHGDIADLTVDQLCTSRRIVRWLASDTSDDNYIRIKDEAINFISGQYVESEDVHCTDPYGRLLYWDSLTQINHETIASGVVTLGNDGYPRVNGERIFTTTTPTTHEDEETGETVIDSSPVYVYTYTDLNKARFNYEMFTKTIETESSETTESGDGTDDGETGEGDGTTESGDGTDDGETGEGDEPSPEPQTITTYYPVLRFGAGNLQQTNYATIKKDETEFSAILVSNAGNPVGFSANAETGKLTLYGWDGNSKSITGLVFTNWDDGSYQIVYSNGETEDVAITFDSQSRPTTFTTPDGYSLNVTW